MAGVERLKQVERFPAAHLADDDAIGTMPKGRPAQVADRDGREAGLFTAGLEADEVRPVDLQLCRILNEDDAVVRWQERRERIEQRRLDVGGGTL